jgi:uncharacterized phage protein (TIGR01671 family)
MRELKFRAWDSDFEEMIEFNVNDGLHAELMGTQQCETQVIMQYTGLKDRNGVEIYCGDIVYCGRHKWDVRWCKYNAKFHLQKYKLFPFDPKEGFQTRSAECLSVSYLKKMQVVGNIHENKELLNG